MQNSKAFIEESGLFLDKIVEELKRVIVGMDETIEFVLYSLLTDSPILLNALPGLAKSLLAEALGRLIGGKVLRLQMKPDLLPSDITGGLLKNKEGILEIVFGEVTEAHLVLVDEINRATPKTQSALLDVLQERKVSLVFAGIKEEKKVPRPFQVIATKNPIEQEGTYPLPEATLDRFAAEVEVDYPSTEQEMEILNRVTLHGRIDDALESLPRRDDEEIDKIHKRIIEMQDFVRNMRPPDAVRKYIVEISGETRRLAKEKKDGGEKNPLKLGASPRAGIHLLKMANAAAFQKGELAPRPDDVRRVAVPVLRHRLIPSYGFENKIDEIIRNILSSIKEPK